jgi:hypothetical protein
MMRMKQVSCDSGKFGQSSGSGAAKRFFFENMEPGVFAHAWTNESPLWSIHHCSLCKSWLVLLGKYALIKYNGCCSNDEQQYKTTKKLHGRKTRERLRARNHVFTVKNECITKEASL